MVLESVLVSFLMLLNCDAGDDSRESLGQQGKQEIKSVNPKGNQTCIFIGRTVLKLSSDTLAT